MSDQCCLCNSQLETREHLFFDCCYTSQAVQHFNKLTGLNLTTSGSSNFILDFTMMTTGVTHSSKFIGLFFLWNNIWTARNNLIFRHIQTSPIKLAEQTYFQLINWTTANTHQDHITPTRNKNRRLLRNRIWTRPSHGFCKINFDGSATSSQFTTCYICRDHDGKIFFLGSHKVGFLHALKTEALAALQAVQMARHYKIQNYS